MVFTGFYQFAFFTSATFGGLGMLQAISGSAPLYRIKHFPTTSTFTFDAILRYLYCLFSLVDTIFINVFFTNRHFIKYIPGTL
jgi:hypothetical protein